MSDMTVEQLKAASKESMTEKITIMFDDIPEKHISRGFIGPYGWFYRQLKNNPNRWALYPGTGPSAHLHCNNYEDFEYCTRQSGDIQIGFMKYVED